MNTFNAHYRFIPWINERIRVNPEFIKINSRLYKNPSPGVVDILLDPINRVKLNWRLVAYFSSDTRLIDLVVEHIVVHLFDNQSDRDNLWRDLCWNESPCAVAAVLSYRKHIAPDILVILYRNKHAGPYIEEASLTDAKKDMVGSAWLSANSCPEAVQLMLDNKDIITWAGTELNTDPRIIAMLISSAPEDFWKNNYVLSALAMNTCPLAVAFLMADPDKIDWRALSGNYSREAVESLSANIDNIYWPAFCANPLPEALALMKANPDKIDISGLAANTNPDAFAMLIDGSPRFAITDELRSILTSNPLIFERVYNNPRGVV
jgi:hypothetical protein